MRLRRIVATAMVAALALTACGGDDDDHGAQVTVTEPIGAPEPEPALDTPPSVAKTARVEMEVAASGVAGAAQAVVDLATSPKIDGFLSSSVVDLEDGYGAATILVQVPTERFEQTVVELGRIGEVTRQEMAGQQLADAGMTREERTAVAAEAALSPIDVAIGARAPAPPPEKSSIEEAVDRAASIALAIASGAIVAAGVVLPVGAAVLVVYLAWSLVLRRLRLRWEQP